MATSIRNKIPGTVFGQITDVNGRPLPNLKVEIYDVDMRNWQPLASMLTDRLGNYNLKWTYEQLTGQDVKEADIAVAVFAGERGVEVYRSTMDEVRFNAGEREEINIIVSAVIKADQVEYDHIVKQVTHLAGDVSIDKLEESRENQDITFLSREAEIPYQRIEYVVVAHRVQNSSHIEAAFFYALFRKNTLLKNDFVNTYHARLSIDLNTEPKTLLYDAALTDKEIIYQDVKMAVEEMIVSPEVMRSIDKYIDMLQSYRQEAEIYYKEEQPKKVTNIISKFLLDDKVAEMARLLEENKGNPVAFFDKINDPNFFQPGERSTDARTVLAMQALLGFDNEVLTRIKDARKISKPEEVKKLARLNKDEWKKELTKISKDNDMVDLQAASIVRKMEKAYPTAAFAAQLEREKTPVLKNQKEIAGFLSKNEDFDLQHDNISAHVKDKAVADELRSVQRIFKLVPHYGKTNALRQQNMQSSQSIVAAGQTRFVNEIAPKAGLDSAEATEVFKKAERVSTAAMLIAGELQDTLRAINIPAMEMDSLALKLEAVSEDFPNLKTLFKLTDTCACEHCRSVYSPAAYLVEILQFLDKRSVTDLTTNTTGHLAKDVLFERRPDLGEIDLGCENANTPLPYVDLVCELLEEAIAPDAGIDFTGVLTAGADPSKGKISNALLAALQTAGLPVTERALIHETEVSTGAATTLPHYLRDQKLVCRIVNTGGNNYKVYRLKQTLSTEAELAAAPEYVNAAAYNILKGANYAFKLPFDLDHVEAKAYFNRFDLSRAELMENFEVAGNPTAESMAAERLGLTDAERTLIVTPRATVLDQQGFWNAPASWDDPPVAGDVLAYMKRIDHFLDKTGLLYKDVDLLLTLSFIDPADQLFIQHLNLTCDTAQKEIAFFDAAALDRVHRFLRLQKKTGWKLEVLDQVINQAKLGNKILDDACLVKAADLLKLSQKTSIKIDELIGFYGEIPHTFLKEGGPVPLYQSIFLNKAKNGFIDEGLLPENVDGTQPLSNFISSISVCLQIKQQDLNKLLPLLPDGNLNFANLSYLLAAARLMKKLRLSADDFVVLSNLTGLNITNSVTDTLSFVEAANELPASPLKLTDVKFMLQHDATNLPDREMKEEKITATLEKLQKDYQANFTANRSVFDVNKTAEEQKEPLQLLLSKLPNVSEEDVKTFVKFIDRNWTSANDAKTFVDSELIGLFDTTAINAMIDALAAAPGPDITAEQNNLVQAYLEAIAGYNLDTGKQLILEQTLATTFKTDVELVKVVLQYAQLKQPAPGTSYVSDVLGTDALIDTVNPVPAPPAVNIAAFPEQYRAIRLLYKLFPLVNAFALPTTDVAWFFANNNSLGWFEFDSIPYEVAHTAIPYTSYRAFVKIRDLLKKYTPVPNPLDPGQPTSFFTIAAMLLPASGVTRTQFLEAFALLTGYAKDDLDAIDTYLFPAFNINNYNDAANWKAVIDCAEHLRTIGITLTEVQALIKPVLTNADTNMLRTALKARYEEETWLSTLKEIMNSIRARKRDALVAYLLAENPEMETENDLYDYFLVDVEMGSCMPSSRIVQAHGTIQLFVQRCLMGLEPKAAADLNNDSNWNQWKWMKNYRVWEANRKVFLYPENWIEAELRDDKSFLFTELENEIQQNELTEFTAEEALIRYVEKLDNIAFLEVSATWYQSDIKTMHVFARTKGGEPSIYYYRRFEKERYWTPWEKVELDITGDHLLAFERNNRLCLAWPVFSEIPDPNPKSTIPSADATEPVANDKPKRRLKIQLAVSELANKKWLPKKTSKDGIETPSNTYTADEEWFKKDKYNMLYFELTQQVWFFSTTANNDYNIDINGIFNVTGCKGYPELAFQGNQNFADFFPDFRDTWLKTQRYNEHGTIAADELAVRNAISFFNFFEILKTTPGTFRISYPHQFTKIDLIAFLFEYLLLQAYGGGTRAVAGERRLLKLPLGTLLPYFKEDSRHAYVIVPGFYKTERNGNSDEQIVVQRTGSDVMKFIEDVIALFVKYLAKYQQNPDLEKLLEELVADPEYQRIVEEFKLYTSLQYGEQFKNLYHPLICALRKTLYRDGVPELMKRQTQLQRTAFNFETYYNPNAAIVPKTYTLEEGGVKTLVWPVEDVDFSSDGAYSGYNWELFFHVPFLLATRLTQNQRYEEAMTWFHYMFNPTGALEGNAPEKYWVTKPFYLTHTADYINQRIDTLLYKIADPNTPERKELEFAIDQWRTKPFKPHVVARFRPVAYQKALLMKYIDNLTEWGDYLFRQDTMESIVQATQMYILADKLLGPKPRIIPPTVKAPYETYNQIEAKLDAFGNALIDLENILPDFSVLPEGGDELPPAPLTLSMLYFCIPQNDKMLEYWDRVADRLFKIRHCQNIDGVERSLALFAPPIDPGMLVRAAAAGLDLSSVIAGINAPTPYYRFTVFAQKATELVQDVKGLGISLMQALEKKDSEAMSLLRSELEMKMLNAMKDVKKLQIKEANEQIEVLKRAKATTEEKSKYFSAIQKIIAKEQLNLDKLSESHDYTMASQIVQASAGALALIPDLVIGASGFGGSPHAAAKWGGTFLSHAASAASSVLQVLSTAASYEANRASILGSYDRRFDEWKLQDRLSKKELAQIDQQITAAEIRKELSELDLKNHELQIENSKKADEFMKTKFTNKELYDWMVGQISAVYFKSYQLAHDFAKKAERCYKFELGNDDTFIQYGYWDSMKKGLQSADQLIYDIKRMQTSYLEKNKREYEITKHVSLTQLDPLALIRLKATGVCDFEVPEVLFDMDFPGQYFRRIKSVSISLPCIAGPYTSVSAKLSLVNNRYRKNTNPDNLAATGYPEDPANDERFIYNVGAIQSIAASNAQNDHGLFELSFKEERYLPFEGCGAVSTWRLELPTEVRQFDYNTISDVILHIKYTAREGGSTLRGLAEDALKDSLAAIKQQLSQTGLHIALNMRQDMASEWLLLKNNGTVNLTIGKLRLPYIAQTMAAAIENVVLVAKVQGNPASYAVNIDGGAVNLSRVDEWELLREVTNAIELDTAFDLSVGTPAALEELMLVVKYSF